MQKANVRNESYPLSRVRYHKMQKPMLATCEISQDEEANARNKSYTLSRVRYHKL